MCIHPSVISTDIVVPHREIIICSWRDQISHNEKSLLHAVK